MVRRLLMLPILLMAQDQRPWLDPTAIPTGLTGNAISIAPAIVLTEVDLRRQELLASLAGTSAQSFPGALPWYSLKEIGVHGLYPLENILHSDPLLFLEMCLRRYEREVQGYSLIFRKREPKYSKNTEKVEVHFREGPFSLHMNWLEGAGRAKKLVYVEGQNDNHMQVRPNGIGINFLILSKPVDGPDAKSSGRYTPNQFGFYRSTQRTIASMRKAQATGALFVKYLGVYPVPEVGDRPCYKFVRSPYQPVEEEGVNELTIYIDVETWLQVGSVLKNTKGELLAEYFFRNVRLNPKLDGKLFTRDAL